MKRMFAIAAALALGTGAAFADDKPTDDEVKLWRDAAAPLVDAWRADVKAKGADPEAIYQSYIEALKRNGSLYQ